MNPLILNFEISVNKQSPYQFFNVHLVNTNSGKYRRMYFCQRCIIFSEICYNT